MINIKIEGFEGPLDLLLHLVSKFEVDIYDVPLLEVIEQYLDYIHSMQTLELEVAGEYLVMASHLLLIKSRMLLPAVEVEAYEEETPERDLLDKIEEYRRYKEASEILVEKHFERAQFLSRPKEELMIEETLELINPYEKIDLFIAFNQLLLKQKTTLREKTTIDEELFSVEDKIASLKASFNQHQRLLFSQLFQADVTMSELVTTFLALLELVKESYLSFSQTENFEEIEIERVIL
ncbi:MULTISPECIES: segregation/condensation protein A [unclassified Enterococcus]|uniref:segregation/condensation protein A n=1 Tax=unclassified Enterococcus TaxID=2608891 RepID=UPI0015550D25|nr:MULTISPECIES: segregation/condensation protein A [unclassified Enterococcus]MBS7577386.1 segregation/condensation protein A [Enterococcus sp. MMGLQ5-2]MBS7584793.1 segregation/condensation protein A [Enterococcus sp. MMGLQ5-1]NPD12648.1 segregation/condensation protein A [Enterococcus sp. MMGLQ5-1]NPD37220.1 segregation/condensation protein A [Enterococcus sp. MMGLQ5-2]